MKRSLLILASFLVLLTSKAMAWEAGDVVYNNLHEGRTEIIKVVDRKRDLYLVRILEGDRAGKVMEMVAGQNFEEITSEDGEHQAQIIRASGPSLAACSDKLYTELGIFESDANRACQYGRDTQFLTCTVGLARSIGQEYVVAAGYFCSQKLSNNSLKCATQLYLRGGQNGDKAAALCANGVNSQLNNCIIENFRTGKRSADSAREYCQSQFDPAIIAAREAAAKAARERAEAERRAVEEARLRLEAAKRAAEEARRQAVEEEKRKIEDARRQIEEIKRQQQQHQQEQIEAAKRQAEEIRKQQQQDAQKKNEVVVVKKQEEKKPVVVQPAPKAEPKKATPAPTPKKTAPAPKVEDDSLPPLPHEPAAPKSSENKQKTSTGGEEGILVDLPLE